MAAAKMMISTTDNFLKGLQFQLEILACIAAWQTTKQTVRLCLMETRGERECSVLLWWYGMVVPTSMVGRDGWWW